MSEAKETLTGITPKPVKLVLANGTVFVLSPITGLLMAEIEDEFDITYAEFWSWVSGELAKGKQKLLFRFTALLARARNPEITWVDVGNAVGLENGDMTLVWQAISKVLERSFPATMDAVTKKLEEAKGEAPLEEKTVTVAKKKKKVPSSV